MNNNQWLVFLIEYIVQVFLAWLKNRMGNWMDENLTETVI